MRIIKQAQISQRILDFLALIELRTADHRIGDTALNQHFLEYTRLRVSAVQHRHIAQLSAFIQLQLLHIFNHITCFISFIIRLIVNNFRTIAVGSPQIFRLASAVIVDNGIGGIQNNLRTTVVLLQLHQLGIGIILLKIKDILDISTAPAVNALVGIAYYADVSVACSQQFRQQVLRMVGVLIFVNHQIIKLALVFFSYRRIFLQQTQRQQQQIVKVYGIVGLQLFLISIINFCHLLLIVAGGLASVGIWQQQSIFRIADMADNRRQRETLFIQIHFLQHLLNQVFAVAGIVNSKIIGIAVEIFQLIAQKTGAEGMEGKQPHISGRSACHTVHALAHFRGGFIGKGNRQNAIGTHALLQQMGNTAGQHLRLAAACTRQNQHRSVNSLYCIKLLFIESLHCIGHQLLASIIFHGCTCILFLGKNIFDLNIISQNASLRRRKAAALA